jgi:hypothetical protein
MNLLCAKTLGVVPSYQCALEPGGCHGRGFDLGRVADVERGLEARGFLSPVRLLPLDGETRRKAL